MRNRHDAVCGECEHLTDLGCEQAAEALAQEGWPKDIVVHLHPQADASRCPEFSEYDPTGPDGTGDSRGRHNDDYMGLFGFAAGVAKAQAAVTSQVSSWPEEAA